MNFEECFDFVGYNQNSKPLSLFDWFINQDHIPFDMSSDAHGTHYVVYRDFLKNLQELYNNTGHIYYWFNQKGELFSDGEIEEISAYSIKLNKMKMRQYKLEEILN